VLQVSSTQIESLLSMPVYKVQRMKVPVRLHNFLVIVSYEYYLLY